MTIDLTDPMKKETAFRNDVSHSQIGIELDGTTFLNAFGKGLGQAYHIEQKIPLEQIQINTQRCWHLFCEISKTVSPWRYKQLLSTLQSASDPAP